MKSIPLNGTKHAKNQTIDVRAQVHYNIQEVTPPPFRIPAILMKTMMHVIKISVIFLYAAKQMKNAPDREKPKPFHFQLAPNVSATKVCWNYQKCVELQILMFHGHIRKCGATLGWVLPYLGMVGTLRGVDPPFWGFPIRLGPYFIPQHNSVDPFFLQKKIGLSLSHLVPEILGPKVGQFFH